MSEPIGDVAPGHPGGASLPRVWARLRLAAWLAFAMHLVAGLAMVIVLRHGLETQADLTNRLLFLVEHTGMWTTGWLTWNAAALSILYFYAAFAWAHKTDGKTSPSPLSFAVILSTAGIAADLAAEAIEMGILPSIARQALAELAHRPDQSTSAHVFLALHRIAVMLTGYLANGLYTLSAILLTWSTRHAYPAWVSIAGLAVGVSGLALSGVTLANSARGMVWANVVLVPCILIWQMGVALTATRRAEKAQATPADARQTMVKP